MSRFRSPLFPLFVLLLVAATAAPALAGPSLDIRPSVCPNLIDRSGSGYLPMAAVSSADFDFSRVGFVRGSLALRRADGVGGSVPPIYRRSGAVLLDVAAPAPEGLCSTFGVDGLRDLYTVFRNRRVVRALELRNLPMNHSLELCLSGQVLDGTSFDVCDTVVVTDLAIFADQPRDDDIIGELP